MSTPSYPSTTHPTAVKPATELQVPTADGTRPSAVSAPVAQRYLGVVCDRASTLLMVAEYLMARVDHGNDLTSEEVAFLRAHLGGAL